MASVYILTNIAMPGLVKIGWAQDAHERARHLSSATGVPTDFEVVYIFEVEDAFDVEQVAHALLKEHRINTRREFFYTKVGSAVTAVQIAALMAAWNKAGHDARQEFLFRIGVGHLIDESSASERAA